MSGTEENFAAGSAEPAPGLRAAPNDKFGRAPSAKTPFGSGAFSPDQFGGEDEDDGDGDFPPEAGSRAEQDGSQERGGRMVGEELSEAEAGAAHTQKASLFSRLFVPLSISIIVVIGAVGSYQFGLFDRFFSTNEPKSILDSTASTAQQPPAQRLSPMPKLPGFAKNGPAMPAADGRALGSGPGPSQGQAEIRRPGQAGPQVSPLAMSAEVAARGPAGTTPQTQAAGELAGDAERQADNANAALRQMSASVDELRKTTEGLKTSSDAQNFSINKDFSLLAQGLSQRFEVTNGKISAIDGQMNLVSQQETATTEKLSSLQSTLQSMSDQQKSLIDENAELKARIEKLEDELHDTVSIPVQRQSRAVPPTGRVNRRVSAQEPPTKSAEAAPPSAAPAAATSERVLDGYFLRGIARGDNPSAAWVKTPKGFSMANVGQTLEGAGMVKEIRRYGDSWEVVTSQGLIRP